MLVGVVEERDDSEAEEEIRDLSEDAKALDVGIEPELLSLVGGKDCGEDRVASVEEVEAGG